MNAQEVRSRFREFIGADDYRRFVRTVGRASRRKARFLYWQEVLWKRFIADCPLALQPVLDVAPMFSVCDVHDCDLHSPLKDESIEEVRDTPEMDDAIERLFPFAINAHAVCPVCRTAREQWIAEHSETCRVLRCKTTYDEFLRRRQESGFSESILDKINQRSLEIADEMRPGDELWEWDEGGWHHLAGRAGVAIVRNGRVVKQWCDVRS